MGTLIRTNRRAMGAERGKKDKDSGKHKEVEVLFTDMQAARQQEVINACFTALEKGGLDQEIARRIKEEYEKKESGSWHVIVGSSFGAQVTHEQSSLVALNMSIPLPDAPFRRQRQIMVFRHG